MKCYCNIHREMNEAISSIWFGGAVGFVWIFFVQDLSFTFEHLLWWWGLLVTLRLLAVEPVRFILIRRRIKAGK
jgi:hypothetical protein